jgi:hypothetical protein
MAERKIEAKAELEDLLRRLNEASEMFISELKQLDPSQFDVEPNDGASVKRSLERTVDDLNFYYGQLTARCLNLPQPPCLGRSEFSSLREGTMAVQVAHRRYTNLLHDVIPEDLDKTTADDKHVTYSLRQLIEMTAAHYNLRVRQIRAAAESASTPG